MTSENRKRNSKHFISSCLRVFVAGICLSFLPGVMACSKPLASAKVAKDVGYVSKSFAVDTTEAFSAVRWALKINGYPIANENVQDGIVTTTWIPTTSDSHAIELFNRRDFGVNGAYHQLEVHVVSEDGRTRIDVGSRVKSVAQGVKSTGIEERKVLNEVAKYLRVSEPTITNLGREGS